jgi:hypothetical protein
VSALSLVVDVVPGEGTVLVADDSAVSVPGAAAAIGEGDLVASLYQPPHVKFGDGPVTTLTVGAHSARRLVIGDEAA